MSTPPDDAPKPDAPAAPEPTAKQLAERGSAGLAEVIDAKTRAELERWFSLPSFTEVVERPKPKLDDDPDVAAILESRKNALAAVDPDLLARIWARNEYHIAVLPPPKPFALYIDPTIARLDHRMIDQAATIAEPRQVEIPPQLEDDLKDCAPQALLRDLHRPEEDYQKAFEWKDPLGELRVDARELVAAAMRVSPKLTPEGSPLNEARSLIAGLRALRLLPTDEIPRRNRRTKD